MARTYRRKNFEATQNSSWDTKGFKTAGHYTTYDGSWRNWRDTDEITFRPMDKRESYKQRRWYHGEGHPNQYSPGKHYRWYRQRQNRMINKEEVLKWIKANGEYETFCEANPRDCRWDWL